MVRIFVSGVPSGRTNNGRGLGHVSPTIFGVRSNISPKLLNLETSNLVGGFVLGMLRRRTNNYPESGRGLGHVTPTIFGSTVGYPSDSLASCPHCICICLLHIVLYCILCCTVSGIANRDSSTSAVGFVLHCGNRNRHRTTQHPATVCLVLYCLCVDRLQNNQQFLPRDAL